MSNTIAAYDNIWYANRAIERLEKSLSFARTMFRAYDEEPREKGSTIEIRTPGGFTAQPMPITTAADMNPTKTNIVLDQWHGVAFKIGDKEMAYTGERLVNEHISPAMQAMAEKIEASCWELYKDVPNYLDLAAAATISDLVKLRKGLNDLYVPKANRYLAMDSQVEADFLAIPSFLNANEGSDGVQVQREGSLGRKFGLDLFQNDSIPTHAPGTLTVGGGTLANSGAIAVGATSFTLAATTLTGTVKQGDIVSFANGVKVAVGADATAAGNAITITPAAPFLASVPNSTTATMRQSAKAVSMAYQQEAFALVMAPLSERGNGRGAEIATVTDPRTGLALRVSRWYEPKDAEEWIRFDALWGRKTLQGNRAIRFER